MIFNLDSTRKIIDCEIKTRQALNPSYSASAFAKKVGLSQTYLSLILKGDRIITKKIIDKLSEHLKYSENQKNYLLLLAQKERTKDKNTEKILDTALKGLRREHFPDSNYIKFFDVISEWQFSAILEAIQIPGVNKSESAIAQKLNLNLKLVKRSIRTLQELHLVKFEDGKWMRSDTGFLKTSSEVKSNALRKFHKQILKQANSAIENQSLEKRSITGVTTSIDPSRLPEAKKRILEFQRELMQFLEDGERKEVYQIEVLLFQLKGNQMEDLC